MGEIWEKLRKILPKVLTSTWMPELKRFYVACVVDNEINTIRPSGRRKSWQSALSIDVLGLGGRRTFSGANICAHSSIRESICLIWWCRISRLAWKIMNSVSGLLMKIWNNRPWRRYSEFFQMRLSGFQENSWRFFPQVSGISAPVCLTQESRSETGRRVGVWRKPMGL